MATTKHAAVPSLIKAVRIAQYGGSEQLKYEEAPLPEIGPGRVLAKVRYAGVNPVDWKIREGYMKQIRPATFPLTLGQDFAGEIVAGSDESGGFRLGERVFGFGEGTYADFTAAAVTEIAAIPEKIEFAVAAALPTAGLTALQAIRDYVQPRPGMRILIHGAAGSVGSFATQIAKRLGAQVIGTASGEDVVYLRSLGHVQVVDYEHERFETVGQVDAVLDLVGGETVGAANAELAAQAEIRGVNAHFFIVSPSCFPHSAAQAVHNSEQTPQTRCAKSELPVSRATQVRHSSRHSPHSRMHSLIIAGSWANDSDRHGQETTCASKSSVLHGSNLCRGPNGFDRNRATTAGEDDRFAFGPARRRASARDQSLPILHGLASATHQRACARLVSRATANSCSLRRRLWCRLKARSNQA